MTIKSVALCGAVLGVALTTSVSAEGTAISDAFRGVDFTAQLNHWRIDNPAFNDTNFGILGDVRFAFGERISTNLRLGLNQSSLSVESFTFKSTPMTIEAEADYAFDGGFKLGGYLGYTNVNLSFDGDSESLDGLGAGATAGFGTGPFSASAFVGTTRLGLGGEHENITTYGVDAQYQFQNFDVDVYWLQDDIFDESLSKFGIAVGYDLSTTEVPVYLNFGYGSYDIDASLDLAVWTAGVTFPFGGPVAKGRKTLVKHSVYLNLFSDGFAWL